MCSSRHVHVCVSVRMFLWLGGRYSCICLMHLSVCIIYVHLYICTCMLVGMFLYVSVCVSICTFVHICICVCIYMHVCACVCGSGQGRKEAALLHVSVHLCLGRRVISLDDCLQLQNTGEETCVQSKTQPPEIPSCLKVWKITCPFICLSYRVSQPLSSPGIPVLACPLLSVCSAGLFSCYCWGWQPCAVCPFPALAGSPQSVTFLSSSWLVLSKVATLSG